MDNTLDNLGLFEQFFYLNCNTLSQAPAIASVRVNKVIIAHEPKNSALFLSGGIVLIAGYYWKKIRKR
jgi:hypothetical protein